ncbi:unnamed protein product [Anisakis simplex]|uniref:DUF4283 domain-containing protein n=1 Tax=Anisakis simplex TaxID=6269 RepID=A0A0M3JE47_ANISI|nr:unnamed protein product [Anisakis simplex]
MLDLQTQLTAHLTSAHLEYFHRWIKWIFMEWNAAKSVRVKISDLWKIPSEKREELGRCLTEMCLVEERNCEDSNGKEEETAQIPGISDVGIVKFQRKSGDSLQTTFAKGDMLIVSTEQNLACAMGPVEYIDEKCIWLRVSEDFRKSGQLQCVLMELFKSPCHLPVFALDVGASQPISVLFYAVI